MGLGIIYATYQETPELHESTIRLLSFLADNSEELFVISTSDIDEIRLVNCSTIIRPNVGYDIFSYKVGFDKIKKNSNIDKVIFLNSSFLVLDFDSFERTFENFVRALDAECFVGLTKSHQFVTHLQSFYFGLNSKFEHEWFQEWLNSYMPQDSKFETIFHGEIKMSISATEANVTAHSFFKPRVSTRVSGAIRFVLMRRQKYSLLRSILDLKLVKVNPMHSYFDEILSNFGIIKKEVLEYNPYGLNLKHIQSKYPLVSTAHPPIISSSQKMFWDDSNVRIISINRSNPPRIGVHLHLYYENQIPDFVKYLGRIPEPFDIHITTSRESLIPGIIDNFECNALNLVIYLGPNIGRDIAPFIYLMKLGVLDCYKIALKIHSKASLYSKRGDCWRLELLQDLLSSTVSVSKIVETLARGRVGLIGPSKHWLTSNDYWGASRSKYFELAEELIGNVDQTKQLGFFAGSMFWFKPADLVNLKMINHDHFVFELESGQMDGTLAHAIERLFAHLVRSKNGLIYGTKDLSSDISQIESSNRLYVGD
jgi:rhamnosyltransferase